MRPTSGAGEFATVRRLLNEVLSAEELAGHLRNAARTDEDTSKLVDAVLARKRAAGGVLRNDEDLLAAIPPAAAMRLLPYAEKLAESVKVQPERLHFSTFLLANPNYFGTVVDGVLKPVFPMKGNTTYEQLSCVGLNTPLDRLEAVVQVKLNAGYSGGICTNGSMEWVRFFVDLHDNGVWHDVGMGSVRVYDIGGKKPLCYAVYRDFTPIRKICTAENIVKVRAILSWSAQPTPGDPNYNPVWGNVMDVEVQIRPRFVIDFGDIVTKIPWDKIDIPDPIGPIIKEIDHAIPIPLPEPTPINVSEKKRLYARAEVPPHRYAFAEAKQLLLTSAPMATQSKISALSEIGLVESDIADLIGNLIKTDGDVSYEELKCVGLKPENDLLEAVFTVKKKLGYSGSLCKEGSTEYVAFWIDFNDGNGWTYIDTATLQVHDLTQTGAGGVQYAVYVKKDLAKFLVPCEAGARLVRLRAVLSWEDPPPPNNPNWVPTWGNREECQVQLRRGVGKLAAILEVDDVDAEDISVFTGRATGTFVEASGSFVHAPFGQTITIAGTIGIGTDFFGGVAARYKYRVEVKRDEPGSSYEPVLATFTLRKVQRVNGFLVQCAPGEYSCAFSQAPLPAAGEGGESGWYLYHEDLVGPATQEILSDVLMRWPTNASMEGRWKMRLHAKDASNNHYYSDEVTIRIDNTRPNAVLTLLKATFKKKDLPAIECGKFPVGTILEGSFAVSDPGTLPAVGSEFQHHRTASLEIIPAGPASGVTPTTTPPSLAYNPPTVPTTGISGTWILDTTGMQACGYVLRLHAWDRTIADAGYSGGFYNNDDIGFCLE